MCLLCFLLYQMWVTLLVRALDRNVEVLEDVAALLLESSMASNTMGKDVCVMVTRLRSPLGGMRFQSRTSHEKLWYSCYVKMA